MLRVANGSRNQLHDPIHHFQNRSFLFKPDVGACVGSVYEPTLPHDVKY